MNPETIARCELWRESKKLPDGGVWDYNILNDKITYVVYENDGSWSGKSYIVDELPSLPEPDSI